MGFFKSVFGKIRYWSCCGSKPEPAPPVEGPAQSAAVPCTASSSNTARLLPGTHCCSSGSSAWGTSTVGGRENSAYASPGGSIRNASRSPQLGNRPAASGELAPAEICSPTTPPPASSTPAHTALLLRRRQARQLASRQVATPAGASIRPRPPPLFLLLKDSPAPPALRRSLPSPSLPPPESAASTQAEACIAMTTPTAPPPPPARASQAAPPPLQPSPATPTTLPPPPPVAPLSSGTSSTGLAWRRHLLRLSASYLPPPAQGAATAAAQTAQGGSAPQPALRVQRDRRLGEGGYADVYAATLEGSPCAAKAMCVSERLPATQDALKGELRAWRFAYSMPRHPHLALPLCAPVVVDPTRPADAALVGLAGGPQLEGRELGACAEVVVALPLLGSDLVKYLTDDRSLCKALYALSFLRDAARGLVHLHAYGFCHNDVKPTNILTTGHRQGALCDFGSLARAGSAVPCGTEDYYAPERFTNPGSCSFQWDTYALGYSIAVAVGGVCGRRPPCHPVVHGGVAAPPSTPSGWAQHARCCARVIQPAAGLTHGMAGRLQALVLRCMHAQPECRPTAGAVVDALSRLLAEAGW